MTVEVKHQPQRGRIARTGDGPAGTDHAAGADHAAGPEHAGGSEHVADLAELCRSVAELVRAGARPPRRIRLEHLGTAVEVEWDTPAAPAGPGTADRPAGAELPPEEPEDPHRYVCAPMIGTFYHAPEPGAPPYVSVGDTITPGQPIGILEVMKMMSPVEADVAGRVVEILAADGTAVEFQQRLIAVEPA